MNDDARRAAWYYGWAVSQRGSSTSGNWGHKGRRGQRGGSLPGGGHMALGLSSDARRSEKERETIRQRQRTRERNRPSTQIGVEDVHTLRDAERWFTSRSMECDLAGVTNVEAVKETIQAIDDTLTDHPWMTERVGPLKDYGEGREEGKEIRFLGISTVQGKDVPPKIVDLSGDALAMTEDRSTLIRNVGGSVIYFKATGLNSGKGSDLYASIGIVAKPDATLYGATTHEMGHAIWNLASSRGRKSQYTGSLLYGRMEEAHRTALHDAGITERMIKKNVSWYATTDPRECFAEFYLMLRTDPSASGMSKAFTKKLSRWATSINEQFNWEVL